MTDLGTLGGTNSSALDINDSGQVAGVYQTADGLQHPFITGANGAGMTDLGTLGGKASISLRINNSGQVAGWFYNNNSGSFPLNFITGANGAGMTDIYPSLGGTRGYVNGINDSGQVVGRAGTMNDIDQHAFISVAITGASGGMGFSDLGTLGGTFSGATGINNSGQVVGTSNTAGNAATHAFLTGANGAGMTDLGTLGGTYSISTGINDSGQVVGWSHIAGSASEHSFLYSSGAMVDLDLLAPVVAAGWAGLHARDINNRGQIVGYGYLNGAQRAFLLQDVAPPISVVPEPEIWAMLLAGLGLLGFTARRRKIS